MRIVDSFVGYDGDGTLALAKWGFMVDGRCSSITEYTPSGATNVESFSIRRDPSSSSSQRCRGGVRV